jgi:hypothetical protein
MLFRLLIWLVISWGCVSPAFAGWGTVKGDDDRVWEKCFVVVARVADVSALDPKMDPEDGATHLLLLEPLSTLAGTFDPSRQSELRVRLRIAGYADSVPEAPPRGSTILVFIAPSVVARDGKLPPFCVVTDKCPFMPDDGGLVVLRDAADKRILETMRKVRAARGVKESTTRPSK